MSDSTSVPKISLRVQREIDTRKEDGRDFVEAFLRQSHTFLMVYSGYRYCRELTPYLIRTCGSFCLACGKHLTKVPYFWSYECNNGSSLLYCSFCMEKDYAPTSVNDPKNKIDYNVEGLHNLFVFIEEPPRMLLSWEEEAEQLEYRMGFEVLTRQEVERLYCLYERVKK